MQASVSRLNQLLAQDARKLVCQKVHTMLLVFRRKKIQIALHRVGNLLRMQGRNNEMSSLRSLEGRQRSLVIPDRSEAAHGAVQAHAVARMRARDEAGVAIHVAIALSVRAAGLPEGGYVRERQRFVPEHNDLFINLKPRYLVLLKEDVTRLLLLRGVENAFDVLLHGSQLLLRTDRSQTRS